MSPVKTWDVVVIGGGIIGLSLAIALRKQGASVLIVERGEPGREASHAAAGMIAHCDPHTPDLLQPLALASAVMYPEYVHELEDESGLRVDYRRAGTILFTVPTDRPPCAHARPITAEDLARLEPGLQVPATAAFLPEASIDPRQLVAAALKAAKHRGIEVASGAEVVEVEKANDIITGVRTSRTRFAARVVVNCAGAWATQIGPLQIPTSPVKGQMLAVAAPMAYNPQGSPSSPRILRHVVRSPQVYLVPRSDGRIVIGSTVEEVGYDKRVDSATIQMLHKAATAVVPEIAQARMLESWAGLRPGTPDGLPILGSTAIENYFVATGHYRDGILLAPITAHLMAHVIRGLRPELDISAFALSRFEGAKQSRG